MIFLTLHQGGWIFFLTVRGTFSETAARKEDFPPGKSPYVGKEKNTGPPVLKPKNNPTDRRWNQAKTNETERNPNKNADERSKRK